jgi:hypothetical protein
MRRLYAATHRTCNDQDWCDDGWEHRIYDLAMMHVFGDDVWKKLRAHDFSFLEETDANT